MQQHSGTARSAKAAGALILALLAASCIHRGERYDYNDVEKPFPWGGVRVRLMPETSYYRDGVSMMKGPYRFVVVVWLKDGAALPSSCRVRFRSADLLDTSGQPAASLPPGEVEPRVFQVGAPARPNPEGVAHAVLPYTPFDIPHMDYLAAIDFDLDGCGAIDGAHRVREVIEARAEKRRFNPTWEALMGV